MPRRKDAKKNYNNFAPNARAVQEEKEEKTKAENEDGDEGDTLETQAGRDAFIACYDQGGGYITLSSAKAHHILNATLRTT